MFLCLLQCSSPCQRGIQVRMVECVQSGIIVPDSTCNGILRPISQRPCIDSSLCTGKLKWLSILYTELVYP